ncbi:MAG: alpha-amylase [Clostridiales bacterium]|nr:alpha-amylase [Clostridiales bacterium]
MKFKKIISAITAAALTCAFGASLIGCRNDNGGDGYDDSDIVEYDHNGDTASALNVPNDNCRTYYEIFVRSFADSNNDGIGDFKGIIDNLDYLNDGDPNTDTDLGINGIWLMPINPSPSYHKYDATDYYDVDKSYGTLADFDALVKACDDRGIWLQMDLVLNHSSNEHPWFLEAVKEAQKGITVEDSRYMKMYNFVLKDDRPSRGTYYAVPNSNYYYLGNFSKTQPDLNLDSEELREEIKKIVDFWLERGVRSFRLDAVPWAYGFAASDTSSANIEFWTWFNDYCNKKGAEVFAESTPGLARYCYNVGEVWSTSFVIDKYFATGMSNFNFTYAATSSSGFISTAKGSAKSGASSLVKSMAEIQATELKNDSAALLSNFLSNHDGDRSSGSMDATQIKKAAGLYLLMPGNPYIYYGEEIGAAGSGSDPNRRLPFNWGDDSHSNIFDPPGADYKGAQKNGSVKDQKDKTDSILAYYRQAIKLRNRFPEIGRGVMTAYALDKWGVIASLGSFGENSVNEVNELNKSVAVYKLEWNGKSVLIIQNVGKEEAEVKLGKEFNETKLVGSIVASTGSVSVDMKGNVSLPVGGVAVFK